MEAPVNSVVLGEGMASRGTGAHLAAAGAECRWEVLGKHVPLPRASYLGKNKVGYVACWLCNTDMGFFYNKNTFECSLYMLFAKIICCKKLTRVV